MYAYKTARLATGQENLCCHMVTRFYLKRLLAGIEHAQKSINESSPMVKSFHRYKAIELLTEVALQDIYPKGQRYAVSILRYFY